MRSLLSGQIPRRTMLMGYVPFTIVVNLALMGMTLHWWPGDFSFVDTSISDLGQFEKNPAPGFLYCSAMLVFMGLTFIPMVNYIRHAMPVRRSGKRLGYLCGLVSCGALIVLGLCPNDDFELLAAAPLLNTDKLHNVGAYVMAGSIVLSSLFFLGAIRATLRVCHRSRRRPLMCVVGMSLFLLGTVLMTLSMHIHNLIMEVSWKESVFRSFAMWEWLMFVAMLLWTYALVWAAPGAAPTTATMPTSSPTELADGSLIA